MKLINSIFVVGEGISWNDAILDWISSISLLEPISWPRYFTKRGMIEVFQELVSDHLYKQNHEVVQ